MNKHQEKIRRGAALDRYPRMKKQGCPISSMLVEGFGVGCNFWYERAKVLEDALEKFYLFTTHKEKAVEALAKYRGENETRR